MLSTRALTRPSSLAAGLLAAGLLAGAALGQDFDFVDVTAGSGLEYPMGATSFFPGVSVGDVNGDGWLDVCICAGSDQSPQIFLNSGRPLVLSDRGGSGPTVVDRRPRFRRATEQLMPSGAPPASLALFADLDGDGDQDMVAVRRFLDGNGDPDPRDTALMYYEQVGGVYVMGSSPQDLGRYASRLGGLALADLDGDGDLDVVFTHNKAGFGAPGFYVRNDGLPNLVDATASFGAGLGNANRYFGVLLVDFDGDMAPDLHCAVDQFRDFHCRNDGAGLFTDVSNAAGTINTGSDMGLAVGDVENDGDMDIYSTNINTAVLYVNDGAGNFVDEGPARGCGNLTEGLETAVGWGTSMSDLDNDRDVDIVAVAYTTDGALFRNDGTGHFTKIGNDGGLDLRGHGLVPFDYDKDGDLDLILVTGGGADVRFYENRSPGLESRHWLVVELVGGASNRDGVGARVEVTAGGVTMTRFAVNGYSFTSGPPVAPHFGLGDAAVASQVRVTWPSGTVQTFANVPADQYLRIVER